MEGQQPGDPFQRVIQRDGSLMTSQESLEGLQCCTPKCYFTRQEIEEQSPSRKDGISLKKETLVRSLYCSFLQDLGKKLQVPQLTIATAVMLCHRFYMCQSHAKNEWQTMATVSMFLACKVEETPRSLKDVVVVGYETMFKRDPLAGQRVKNKDVYEKQKELVLIGERVLLATVGFDLNIQHPYKPLVTALKRLEISQKDLTKVAWNFVNDWLQTTLCLEYKPHYVAAGSMYLAAKFFKVKLPSEKGKAWWMEFDVTPQRLEEVIQQMVKFLEQSRSPLLFSSREKVKQTTVEKKAESSSPQSCVLSRSNTTSDLRNEVSEKAGDGRSQNISQSVQSVANDDICVARKEEQVSQCQTSDCGSTQSVVEDGNRSDEGEAEPRVVVESNQTASSKVASDKGLLNEIDKERIKEALKKRRYDKLANKKVATTTTHDDGDPESWIVRELEDGIDMQYASAEKKRRL